MAGRLVTIYDRLQLSSSGDGSYLGQSVLPSDVRWKCTAICGYTSPWQPGPALGNDFALVQLHVNQVPVWEVRTSSPTFVDSLTVLPWGDGLRFTAGERVGWNITLIGLQSVWSSTFIGVRI